MDGELKAWLEHQIEHGCAPGGQPVEMSPLYAAGRKAAFHAVLSHLTALPTTPSAEARETRIDEVSDLIGAIRRATAEVGPDFPNYAEWPVSLPMGHWRALVLSLQGEGQPVAWRWRYKSQPEGWMLVEKDPDPGTASIVVQPLFAHPVSEQAGEVERLREQLTHERACTSDENDRYRETLARAEASEQALADMKAERALDREAMQAGVDGLMALCNGHPAAAIAWPHRPLHELADTLRARLSKGEGE